MCAPETYARLKHVPVTGSVYSVLMDADSASPPTPDTGEPDDVDARFAEIVADLGDMPTRFDDATMLPAHRSWQTPEHVEMFEEEQSHFVPPVPPPLFAREGRPVDHSLAAAWIGIIALPLLGIVLVILQVALSFRVPGLLGWVGTGLFVACVIVAVAKMPSHRRQDPGGSV